MQPIKYLTTFKDKVESSSEGLRPFFSTEDNEISLSAKRCKFNRTYILTHSSENFSALFRRRVDVKKLIIVQSFCNVCAKYEEAIFAKFFYFLKKFSSITMRNISPLIKTLH